jgi:hypothetical protein
MIRGGAPNARISGRALGNSQRADRNFALLDHLPDAIT